MKLILTFFICRLFLLTPLLFLVSTMRASDYVVDGIYYNLLEDGAEVVKGDIDYSGSVFIPDGIIYEDKKYRVNGIGKSAKTDFPDITINTITPHVPTVSVEAYKVTEPWKNFKEIVAIVESTQGDAKGNENLDTVDIVTLIDFILGQPFNEIQEKSANLNGDGHIDIANIFMYVNIIQL